MVTATVWAQSNTWVKQAPNPTNTDLFDLQMLSATEAFAVGYNDLAGGNEAVVVHTTNRGQTWDFKYLPTDHLVTVCFLDAQRGWAGGNGMFRTQNGGASWVRISSVSYFTDVQFVDPQNGFAGDDNGNFYRSTDGGLSWTSLYMGDPMSLQRLHFLDAQNGWLADSYGKIFRTTDGGLNWTQLNNLGHTLGLLEFFDTQNGWAIGGPGFFRTSDGGVNWTQVSVPAGTWALDAAFSDPLNGVAVGPQSAKTTDGGLSWQTMPRAPAYTDLWSVDFFDANNGMLAGSSGLVEATTDGGATWSFVSSGGKGTTHALDAVDAQHAWAAQDGGEILRTVDGGTVWQRSYGAGLDKYGQVNDIDFIDQNVGWAVAEHGPFSGIVAKIVRSTDGGRTWTVQYERPWSILEGVEVIDAQTAYAVGYDTGPGGIGGFVVKTTNGGLTWNLTSISPFQDDIEFVDANTGWTVGGGVLKTTDGGQTWVSQFDVGGSCCYVHAVSFADSQNGWFAGWGGIYHTSDGGANWTPQVAPGAPVNQPLYDIHAVSATTAWVVGEDGYAARTQDGGQTWVQENFLAGFQLAFEACHFLDAENGWVGGAVLPPRGGIYARRNGDYVCQTDLGMNGHGLLRISVCGSPLSTGNSALFQANSTYITANRPMFLFLSLNNNPTYINRIKWSLLPWPPLATLPLFLDGSGSLAFPLPGGNGPFTVYFQAVAISPLDYSGYATSNALQIDVLP